MVKRSCAFEAEDADKNECLRVKTPSFVKNLFCETCREDGCNGKIKPVVREEPPASAEGDLEDDDPGFNDLNEDEEEDDDDDGSDLADDDLPLNADRQKEKLTRKEDEVLQDSDIEIEASENRGQTAQAASLRHELGFVFSLLLLSTQL